MRVLIVDDEPSIRRTTRIAVESAGHSASEAPNAAKAVKAAEEEGFDAVFLDLKLGADDGLEVLDRLMKAAAGAGGHPVHGLRQHRDRGRGDAAGGVRLHPQAVHAGPDPRRPGEGRARRTPSSAGCEALESDLASGAPPVDLESAEPAMQRALQIAFKAAETPANILILGPSGTGKSVLAREIHKRSARRDEAFVTVNCPSLSRELFESELFGHAKGSFTGAVAETSGKVAAADGGTLFLDEIGEMPLEIQPKLLRLLQEREYERVGEALPRRADVRVIAATNRDLAAEVKAGPLPRGPLLPAERDRGHPSRAARAAGRPQAARRRRAAVLRVARGQGPDRVLEGGVGGLRRRYPWPGNLRELRNVIERAVILAPGDTIELADLPEEFAAAAAAHVRRRARA